MTKIAIIGAGIAGLTVANELSDFAQIIVYEKSRGTGGRMATRHAVPYAFDHGTPYFIAEKQAGKDAMRDWAKNGYIKPWANMRNHIALSHPPPIDQPGKTYYVATPHMNQFGKSFAANNHIQLSTEIASIISAGKQWQLLDENDKQLGLFDWVVIATAAPQASSLVPPQFSGLNLLNVVSMHGCFTLMLGFEKPFHFDPTKVDLSGSPISHIIENSAKPGRTEEMSLVVHTANAWAEEHLDYDKESVREMLLSATLAALPKGTPHPTHTEIHRWRYAATQIPACVDFIIDTDNQLAACGDWCIGSSVEDAYLSGSRLSERIRNLLAA